MSNFGTDFNKAMTYAIANFPPYNNPEIESKTDEKGRFTAGALADVTGITSYNNAAAVGFSQAIEILSENTYLFIIKLNGSEGEATYNLFAGSITEFDMILNQKSAYSGLFISEKESDMPVTKRADVDNLNKRYSYTYGEDRAKFNVFSIGFAGGVKYWGVEDRYHMRTDIPIFDNSDIKFTDYIYNYLLSGDTSHAIKPPFDKLNLKTDWTVYIDGESHPAVKVVWRNAIIEESDELINKTYTAFCVSSEYAVPNIADPNNKIHILSAERFDSKYLQTSFDEMYEVSDHSSELFRKKRVGLWMSLCYDKEIYSTWAYVILKIEGRPTLDKFNSIVSAYGIANSVLLPSGGIDDGSTLTIKFGSGEDDDGYDDGKDDVEDEDEITNLDTLTSLTRIYKMTQARIESLGSNLWSHEFYELISKINVSPLENILSLRMLPFNVSGTESEVVLGNFHTKVNGERVKKSNFERQKIGEVKIMPYYYNFLDLSPYSRMSIYLPYAGFKEIDASLFYEKTLSVYYAMDIISGGCLIEVYADNLKHYEFNTQIGVDIPISSSNRARIEGLFAVNTTVGTALGSLNGVDGAVKGGVTAALNAAESQFHFNTSSTPNPSCVGSINRQCFVQIDYPNYQDVKRFNSTVGRICMLGKRIGDLSGFTICDSNVNLSNITATSDEKNELSAILSSGFFA